MGRLPAREDFHAADGVAGPVGVPVVGQTFQLRGSAHKKSTLYLKDAVPA